MHPKLKTAMMLAACSIALTAAHGQPLKNGELPATDTAGNVFTCIEQMPQFPGDVMQYLAKNLRYPDSALAAGVEGRAITRFVVNEDGSLYGISVVRSSGNRQLDEEALRLVREMPRWRPGKVQGRAVKVYYTFPITFHLE